MTAPTVAPQWGDQLDLDGAAAPITYKPDSVVVYDSTRVKYITFAHDGTNATVTVSSGDVDFNTAELLDIADPTAAQSAATKTWVETAISTAISSALEYKGTHDASTGSYPATPATGDCWIISAAGIMGGVGYEIGDWCVYNGATWDKIDNSDLVTSVDTRTGAVVVIKTDVYGAGTWAADDTYGASRKAIYDKIQLLALDTLPASPSSAVSFNSQNITSVGTVDGVDISLISLSAMPAAASGDIACDSQKITGLGTPTANTDAATKLYADQAGGGGGANIYIDGDHLDTFGWLLDTGTDEYVEGYFNVPVNANAGRDIRVKIFAAWHDGNEGTPRTFKSGYLCIAAGESLAGALTEADITMAAANQYLQLATCYFDIPNAAIAASDIIHVKLRRNSVAGQQLKVYGMAIEVQ